MALELTPELVWLEKDLEGIRTNEELLTALGRKMTALGFAKEGYERALLNRERKYPTGLPSLPVPVAIVHADACWVQRSALGFARPPEPVLFSNMVAPDEKLPVRLVFLLAVAESDAHTSVLADAVGMIQKADLIESLLRETDKELIVSTLAGELGST